jgi:hypothetical protein
MTNDEVYALVRVIAKRRTPRWFRRTYYRGWRVTRPRIWHVAWLARVHIEGERHGKWKYSAPDAE